MQFDKFVDACFCFGERASLDLVALATRREVFEQQQELVGLLVSLYVVAVRRANVERVTQVAVKRRFDFVTASGFARRATRRVVTRKLRNHRLRQVALPAIGEPQSPAL